MKLFNTLKDHLAKCFFIKTCILCLLPRTDADPNSDLCQACTQQLPRNLLSCERCAIPLHNVAQSGFICGECQKHPPSFDRAIATFRYEYPVDKLISAFKYQQRLDLVPALAKEMSHDLKSIYHFAENKPDGIMPIPLHRLREFGRGYNQAELLAKYLSKELEITLLDDILIRTKATPKQSRLDKKQRRRNLKNAFSFRPNANSALKHVVLIDDVMTTGSTLETASKVLKKAGVERVDVWCLARAEV